MSRRRLHWREQFRQSQDVEKILPKERIVGNGTYWSKMPLFEGIGGVNKKNVCSLPISQKREEQIRQWAARWTK